MINEHPLIKPEKHLIIGALLLLIFSFFYQLGIYPLFLEEPRRGLIALEMIFQDNIWVPTQTGDLYFRKPPVYNWVLIASYKLFGGYTEFATRFFSVFSHLMLSWVTFLFTRKYLGQLTAVLVAMSLLVAADILIYFSTLGEIDLFYALVTAIPIFATYHYGEKKQYWRLFLVVYLFTAIGFLTKGLTSLPYTAITLLVYFIHKRQFKELLRLPHFVGIGLFALLVGGYFFMYSQYEDVTGWWTTLFSESADKATGGGLVKWLEHLITFPLDTIKNILPAGLLIPVLFRKDLLKKLKEDPFVWYCVLVFAFNFLVYWFSTEAKSRYIYPLFPFLIVPIIHIAIQGRSDVWRKVMNVMAYVFIGLFALVPIVGFLSNELEVVTSLNVILSIVLSFVLILWYMFLVKKVRPYIIVLAVMVVLKFGFSAIVPVTRALDTGAAEDKTLGYEIVELTKGQPLHRYGDLRMSLTIVFYVEAGREEPIYQKSDFEQGFYFVHAEDFPRHMDYVQHKEFAYWGEPVFLIEIKK
ncbi:glycosyltransferase family 39 protein [Roseivirga sp. E12]|uniref:ArnT family glycosyltransferase n=1 Tax=Roseivirga sp. E12 TaxID=2819237 RepID=UPI001ABC435E|nr:glycosyltransferase family 39 protein [Roseivirga sp. E12]MBO3696867.1 glycosyltransferase family 39 protein [Roseivirga sp. E12]